MGYRHTQIGWVGISAGVLIFLLGHDSVAFVICLLIISSFATLTVTVDKEFLRISFGIGLFKMKFNLKEIKSYGKIRNKWWCGWGIHGWPKKGWLYNVSGLNAVELNMKNGMKYLIGTNEPEKLLGAINLNRETLA